MTKSQTLDPAIVIVNDHAFNMVSTPKEKF